MMLNFVKSFLLECFNISQFYRGKQNCRTAQFLFFCKFFFKYMHLHSWLACINMYVSVWVDIHDYLHTYTNVAYPNPFPSKFDILIRLVNNLKWNILRHWVFQNRQNYLISILNISCCIVCFPLDKRMSDKACWACSV